MYILQMPLTVFSDIPLTFFLSTVGKNATSSIMLFACGSLTIKHVKLLIYHFLLARQSNKYIKKSGRLLEKDLPNIFSIELSNKIQSLQKKSMAKDERPLLAELSASQAIPQYKKKTLFEITFNSSMGSL